LGILDGQLGRFRGAPVSSIWHEEVLSQPLPALAQGLRMGINLLHLSCVSTQGEEVMKILVVISAQIFTSDGIKYPGSGSPDLP
jgi:hypothetical protein